MTAFLKWTSSQLSQGSWSSIYVSIASEGWFPTIKRAWRTRFYLVQQYHFLWYESTVRLLSSTCLLQYFFAAPSFLSTFLHILSIPDFNITATFWRALALHVKVSCDAPVTFWAYHSERKRPTPKDEGSKRFCRQQTKLWRVCTHYLVGLGHYLVGLRARVRVLYLRLKLRMA